MAGKKDEAPKRFEEALQALDGLVNRLEAGDLPLEEALATFEQGIGLVRLLNDKLTHAEKQVELLSRDADGQIRLQTVERIGEKPA